MMVGHAAILCSNRSEDHCPSALSQTCPDCDFAGSRGLGEMCTAPRHATNKTPLRLVAALKTAIPEADDQIGTVDRFQGQEAPMVIYSMTRLDVSNDQRNNCRSIAVGVNATGGDEMELLHAAREVGVKSSGDAKSLRLTRRQIFWS